MKKSVAFTIFGVMAAVIIGVGVYAWTLDSRLENAARAGAAYGGGAVGEFAGALAELDESMRESCYATDSALQSTLCAKAAANAASAVTALASMPGATQELETLSQYINGAGDYTLYLSKETAQGRTLTEDERETLSQLSAAVSDISFETGGIFSALDAGDVLLDEYGSTLSEAEGTVGAALAKLDAALDDFPQLEYDGLYSYTDGTAELVYGLATVNEETARQKAADFLGVERSALNPTGLSGGDVPCYGFELTEGDSTRWVSVTEQGGIVASVTGSCSGGEAAVTAEEAEDTAAQFLAGRFDGEFAVMSVSEQPGAFAFTFAPVENDILLLPDTISVTVDAATGEVCACSAANYILYHGEREALAPAVDEESAAAVVSSSLTIEDSRLVLTRSDGGDEALCWEFACTDGDGNPVYVFVDAEMGREVKIELART